MTLLTPHEKQFHQRFSEYGRNAREWLRKCALLLPEIDRLDIWKKKGFGSIYEYAAKLAGMSKNSVREALRVMKHIEDKPELKKVLEEKGINSVRPVATIATEETDAFWAQKARDMPKNTLETYVSDFKRSHPRVTSQPEKPLKTTVEVELEPTLAERLERIKKRKDFNTLLEQFMEAIEVSEEAEKPKPVVSESHYIPVKIDHYSRKKTGHMCAYPSCTREGEVLHHTQRFKSERVHDPDRLVLLCKDHHQIAHLGLIENEEGPVETWRLRTEADKTIFKYVIDQRVNEYRRAAVRRGG